MRPKIICIDFGTSSIRAAVRDTEMGNPRPLELGEAVRSTIDRASVPSACFIAKDHNVVCFGEEALARGLRGDPEALFEISPKRWMTIDGPRSLVEPAVKGLPFSRRDLLVGLFAQVWSALEIATGESIADLLACDVRVSHPVWDASEEEGLQAALYEILDEAAALSGKTDVPVSVEAFCDLVPAPVGDRTAHEVDVIEPVAATLHVFRHAENAREACMIVDVGAGTTDLALFVSVTPVKRQRKFIRVARPISVTKAGDVIDEAMLDLLCSRRATLGQVERADVKRRRRSIKEDLFKRGRVSVAGLELAVGQVATHPLIVEMRANIAEAARTILSEAAPILSTYNSAAFRLQQIDLVFVGGGATINFIHEAVRHGAKLVGSVPPLMTRTLPQGVPAGSPASIERLAVALGGTSPESMWPETRMTEPVHYRGVGS